MILDRTLRQVLDVGDAKDDGGWEADEGKVIGIGIEKTIPIVGNVGPEYT